MQSGGRLGWTQAPTAELAELLNRMHNPLPTKKPSSGRGVTFPSSARYFLTCLPAEVPSSKTKKTLHLSDDKFFWPWIGLYNSHLFHAWWLMVGDAFHVLKWQYKHICAPEGWVDESLRHRTEQAARSLIDEEALKSCYIAPKGTAGANYNFHEEGTLASLVIEELDRLLIEAYGLSQEPLLTQMRIIRTGSAHEL